MKNCMSCGGSMGKKKMAKGGQALNKAKGFAKSTTGGSNISKNIFGVPNAGPTGPNRTGTYDYQKGGAFAPNRAVQPSCKNGMVRDADGKCVTARKMEMGGSLKPVNKMQNPGLAKLPTAVRNKMGYMKKGGAKKK
jgi:hypothetical protein